MFAEHLEDHLGSELAWLQRMYESKTAVAQGLSVATVTEFFAWNQEVCPLPPHPPPTPPFNTPPNPTYARLIRAQIYLYAQIYFYALT